MSELDYYFFKSTPENIEIVKEINSLLENVQLNEKEINETIIELNSLVDNKDKLFTKAISQILYNIYSRHHNMLSYEMLALKFNIDDAIRNFAFRDPITIVQEKLNGTKETHHINLEHHIISVQESEKLHFYNMSDLLFTLEVDEGSWCNKTDIIECTGDDIQFLQPMYNEIHFKLTYFNYKAVLEALQLGLIDGVKDEAKLYYTDIVEVRKRLFEKGDYDTLLDSLRFDDINKFTVIFHKYVSSIEKVIVYKHTYDERDEDYREYITYKDLDIVQLFLKYAAEYNATQCFKFIWVQLGDKEKHSLSVIDAIDDMSHSIVAHRNYELLHLISQDNNWSDYFVEAAVKSYNFEVLSYYYDNDKLPYKQDISEGNLNKIETRDRLERMQNKAKEQLNFLAWIHIQETPIDLGITKEDEEKYKRNLAFYFDSDTDSDTEYEYEEEYEEEEEEESEKEIIVIRHRNKLHDF